MVGNISKYTIYRRSNFLYKKKSTKKFYKKPKTNVKSDKLQKIENSLLALKVFGGITKTKVPLDVPDDETKLSELELIFNSEHESIENADYEKEASELLSFYNKELNKQKIALLTEKIGELDEDSDEYTDTLNEITDLQKTIN